MLLADLPPNLVFEIISLPLVVNTRGVGHDSQKQAQDLTRLVFVGKNGNALIVLLSPLRLHLRWLNASCVAMIIGIWIEKGMGLIVPGFIPSPLGEIVEYTPTMNEILVCLGIWAVGLLLYTIMVRITVPVLRGLAMCWLRGRSGILP